MTTLPINDADVTFVCEYQKLKTKKSGMNLSQSNEQKDDIRFIFVILDYLCLIH